MEKSICVACDGFPYKNNSEYSFVKELCVELVRQGIDVTVIAPQSISSILIRGTKKIPKFYTCAVDDKEIKVYRPMSLSFGGRFRKIQYYVNSRVIENLIKKYKLKFEIFYGHFWHSAFQLFSIAKRENKKLIVATGESHIFLGDDYTCDKLRPFLDYVNNVICVSSKNKDESIKLGFCNAKKCEVIPNAVNLNHFYKIDGKKKLRSKYNIPQDKFIVGFLGAFIERKGANRVSEAIKLLGNHNVKGIFIGKNQDGNIALAPDPEISAFCGPVPHDQVVDLLNCADIFVLPTLQEGCCNAIIEAMACGLPIVSSNLNFNYDILDNSNSILINPLNIKEISEAIHTLSINQAMRDNMANASLRKAQQLSISQRAGRIKSLLFN